MVMTTEEQSRTEPQSHGERISRLEAIIETVLPHLATKEDVARSETRIILWVVGTVVGSGVSVALGLGGLLVLLLN